MTNFSPKNMSCISRDILQGNDDKISRPSAKFMIITSVEYQKSLIFEVPEKYFMSEKVEA